MIKIEFFGTKELVTGFHVSGHADYAQHGSDIVCAAVSSATYMTVNTITDIVKVKADVKENNGDMYLKLDISDAQRCSDIMQGFVLHVTSLAEDYKQYITVTISEV